MSEMGFMPVLKEFVRDNKKIYTVRAYWYGIETYARVANLGLVKRKAVKRIQDITDLEEYVSMSGFNTKEEWWSRLRCFIPGNKTMYLYEVTLE